MILDKSKKILIIGLGLMGGSYAKALSKKGYHIEALTLDQKDIDYALMCGMIERGYTEPNEESVSGADIVIFALYPRTFLDWVKNYGHLIKPGAVVTDLTGVKSGIIRPVQEMLSQAEFISAHPMAGRELYGVEHSDDTVFAGANYIVVPTEKNTREAIDFCKTLGKELGFSRITELDEKEHDEMIAFLSQLTHCIAVSLMTCRDKCEHFVDYTGDSFRDLTRIAKINDNMWSELFLMNKEALLEQMRLFETEFGKMREMIEADDRESLRDMMRRSTERRKLFDKK